MQTSNLAAKFRQLIGRMQSGNEGNALQQAAAKDIFVTAGDQLALTSVLLVFVREAV